MPFGLEAGLIFPVFYMCICEVLRKKPSEHFLIVFGGIGFIINSYLGQIGHILSAEKSLTSSVVGVLIAFILFLPYRSFYPKQWVLFYYLATISIWLGPLEFLYFYFYTALVCGLLSIIILIKQHRFLGSSMSLLKYWKSIKKSEGNSGVYAPYYTASLFGYLGVILQMGIQK